MYAENTLQMEWCLDCHRNPAKNLRPTGEIYNMAWEGPTEDRPVWCAAADKSDVPTAESVSCTTKDPKSVAALTSPALLEPASLTTSPSPAGSSPAASPVHKFTSQEDLGKFLEVHYKIRTPKDLTSCEVCHR